MALKEGDVLEFAIWMDGRETEEMKLDYAKQLSSVIAGIPAITGPLMMHEMRPGEDRMPEVPKGMMGPDVRLLVGESTVISLLEETEGNFVGDLEPKDLERLRAILRRVHRSWNPGSPELSTEKCDEYINRNGPNAALDALRNQVGVKVH